MRRPPVSALDVRRPDCQSQTIVRRHLTYANLMSTLAVFLVLAGGTAFAAKQLGKKTVGTKQLKGNAVTKAKIKKNAVTAAKIRANAVNGAKIADGSVTGAEIDAPSTPFSQVVARIRNTTPAALASEPKIYPLGAYTQAAGETNQWIAGLDVTFAATCAPPRSAIAYLLLNPANPAVPKAADVVGAGNVEDTGTGTVKKTFSIGSYPGALQPLSRTAPAAPVQQSFLLYLVALCNSGSGVTVDGTGLDVIGTK